ncbi:chondroitinase B-like protein [Motilibacter rhizosphaerae]|uniref:Chondroitinase B-like protein n=1 Tax=Motilibacter rhizosphaerae TaxID=598652 RepID=A0A4Q7N7A5_9ACTN|nr:chondroitinase-B domain-containing protein [Motilibacter rhizosphaerae]RZS77925.1 chondroitinase B-like protein [Motilibacter rhizosphaerae]
MDRTASRIAGAILAVVFVAAIVGFSGLVDFGSSGRQAVPSPFGSAVPGAPTPGSADAVRVAASPSLPPYTAQAQPDLTVPGATAAAAPKGAVPLESLGGEVVQSPLTVAAPGGTTTVVWLVDHQVLAKQTAAPFAVTLKLAKGEHHLEARATVGGSPHRYRARFTVSGTAAPVATVVRASVPLSSLPPAKHTVHVSGADELTTALARAKPGDRIQLADGTYTSTQFEASGSGTRTAPVVLVGSPRAVLTTGETTKGGYALHVTGSYWHLVGFTVRTAKKGIVLDGSIGSVLQGLDVGSIGEEGVHFRDGSSSSSIIDSTVHDTGLFQARFGEGVYVGSAQSNWGKVTGGKPDRTDHVLIADDTVSNTAAEGIDVKEGTTGGVIRGVHFSKDGTSGQNSADSWVDIKGNDWTVTGNSGSTTLLDAFQVHQVLAGWGQDNVFRGNRVAGGVPGWTVGVYPPKAASGNRVACDDTGAHEGVSNIACG